MPVETREAAEDAYLVLKKKYYDATHNCPAYRIDALQFRYSDDGEPSGTAGKPIYQEICGQNMWEILCVVTRYFGGTKLGTGGLARAYARVTREALEIVPVKIKTHYRQANLEFAYTFENPVRRILNDFKGRIMDADYGSAVQMKVQIPASRMDGFIKTVIEFSNAQIVVREL